MSAYLIKKKNQINLTKKAKIDTGKSEKYKKLLVLTSFLQKNLPTTRIKNQMKAFKTRE